MTTLHSDLPFQLALDPETDHATDNASCGGCGGGCQTETHQHTKTRPSGTVFQRYLNNRPACLATAFAFLALIHYVLIHWTLSGGFPGETLLGNVLSAVIAGLVFGAVEGRMSARHEASQKVMDMPLSQFVERFRMSFVLGAFAALIAVTLLELGTSLQQIMPGWSVVWAVGSGILAVLVGLTTLWFSFSWGRWCFGEIRWN